MLTLLTPAAAGHGSGPAFATCLAVGEGGVVPLAEEGVRNLRRSQSPAEIHALRGVLAGASGTVGLVLCGRISSPVTSSVAVSDHVAFTVPSPLVGPNADEYGPRFPATVGLYDPEAVLAAVGGGPAAQVPGPVTSTGVVVCVREGGRPSPLEERVQAAVSAVAVSAELAPVALVAAHMGLRVAALLLDEGDLA